MKLDLVDVFGADGNTGNPLAVVHDAEAMSADAMLALTRWLGFFGNHLPDPRDRSGGGLSGPHLLPGGASCPLPGIRHSAPAMPGSKRAECHAIRA